MAAPQQQSVVGASAESSQATIPLIDESDWTNDKLATITETLRAMNALKEALCAHLDIKADKARYATALQEMATFLHLTLGNANQLQEKITALTVRDSGLGELTHRVKGGRGADLQSTIGSVEDKTSKSPTKYNGYKTNWLFGSLKVQNKADLANKLRAKMSAGVVFKAIDAVSSNVLGTYVIDGAFMVNYLTRKTTISNGYTKCVNLGCKRCTTCGHYHRILYLSCWAKRVVDGVIQENDWKRIDKPIPSQCNSLTVEDGMFMDLKVVDSS